MIERDLSTSNKAPVFYISHQLSTVILMFNAQWLQALTLPFKIQVSAGITAGIFLYFWPRMAAEFGEYSNVIKPALIFVLVYCSISVLYECMSNSMRLIRRWRSRTKHRKNIESHLGSLSPEELFIVEEAIMTNSKTVYKRVTNGATAALCSKNLLQHPVGVVSQNNCPFTFSDDAWDIILEQQDNLLSQGEEWRNGGYEPF